MHAVAEHSDGWREWRRKRLRRSWVFLAIAMLSLLTALAALTVAMSVLEVATQADEITDGYATEIGVPWFGRAALVGVAFHGVLAVILVFGALRDRALVRRVVETDGCVCPKCAVTMRLVPCPETPARLDDRDLGCGRCGAVLRAGAVRRYWEQTLVSPQWAQQWKAQHVSKGGFGRLIHKINDGARRRPTTFTIASFGIITGLFVAVGLVMNANVVAALLFAAPMLLFFAGAGVMYLVVRRSLHADDVRRCADCGYEQPAEGSVAERCPECGADWHRVGGTTVGRPQSAHRPQAIAMVMFATVIVVLIAALNVNRFAPRVLPTPALISLLATGGVRDEQLVTELESRTLDASARRQLAERIVKLRSERDYLDDAVEALLERLFLAGDLDGPTADAGDRSLRDRFLETTMSATIEGPERAAPGEEITLTVAGTPRVRPFSALEIQYVWGGWRLDGGEPIGRGASIASGYTLWPRPIQAHGRGAPALTIKTPSPGTVTVRGDLWVVVEAAGLPKRGVRWNADGTPTVDDPPPLALFPIALERVITVR